MPDKAFSIYGQALQDYLKNNARHLWLHTSYGKREEMPVEVFFREAEDLNELELEALSLCRGRTLDVGAGAGALSLILQEKLEVTALEIDPLACQVMRELGVKNIRHADFFSYSDAPFDTLLLQMNGIGFIGRLNRVGEFLQKAGTLLLPGGQIIGDSSDIAYLYRDYPIEKPAGYYGEVSYRYEYRGNKGPWFDWLYLDQQTLSLEASRFGWQTEILARDELNQYLFRLTR